MLSDGVAWLKAAGKANNKKYKAIASWDVFKSNLVDVELTKDLDAFRSTYGPTEQIVVRERDRAVESTILEPGVEGPELMPAGLKRINTDKA